MTLKKFYVALCAGAALTVSPIWANEGYAPHPMGGDQSPAKYTIFTGKFTAVDAAGGSVSLENKAGEKHTVAVPANAKIEVNGKPAGLADVQVGMYGGVKLEGDPPTVVMLKAQSAGPANGEHKHMFSGIVTAANGNSFTLTKKSGETGTFAVNADTKVLVGNQPSTADAIQVNMYGYVKLTDDDKTAVEVHLFEQKTPHYK
jgi:hypothetical protein